MQEPLAIQQRPWPILRGPHYNLIPFTEAHITARYLGWLNDPEVNRFLELRLVHQTRETALAFVRSFFGETEKYMWAVCVNDGDEPIGTTTLYNIGRYHGCVEFGLLIGDKRYWGKGASEEAIELLARFAFDDLGLRRMTGGTYACNHGMNFTYRKLGFTLEGKERTAFHVRPGVYVHGLRWGLLADEWRLRHGHASQR